MIKYTYMVIGSFLLIIVLIVYACNTKKDELVEKKNFEKSIEIESFFFLGFKVWSHTKLINYYNDNGKVIKVYYKDADSTKFIYNYDDYGNMKSMVTIKNDIITRLDSLFYDSLNRFFLEKSYSIGLENEMYLQNEWRKDYYDNDSLKYAEIIQYNQSKNVSDVTKLTYKYGDNLYIKEKLVTGDGGGEYRIKYEYDKEGFLQMKIDGFLKDTLLYSYVNGKVDEIVKKSGKKQKLREKFWYDKNGNLVKNYSVLDGIGYEYEFEYDKFNRVVKKWFPGRLYLVLKPCILIKYD